MLADCAKFHFWGLPVSLGRRETVLEGTTEFRVGVEGVGYLLLLLVTPTGSVCQASGQQQKSVILCEFSQLCLYFKHIKKLVDILVGSAADRVLQLEGCSDVGRVDRVGLGPGRVWPDGPQ